MSDDFQRGLQAVQRCMADRQARMWREYAQAWDEKVTSSGVGREWVKKVLQFVAYARQVIAPTEYDDDLEGALRDFWDSEIRSRDADGNPIEDEPAHRPAVETNERLCEHVPPGFACEICNHDGKP